MRYPPRMKNIVGGVMELNISQGIIQSYFTKLQTNLDVDAAIVGGGPSGITAAYYLAKEGFKVALFDQKLAPGGGMWGGAMMFNKIVVQNNALDILNDFSIPIEQTAPMSDSHFIIDSVLATSSLIYHATKAGAAFFNCISVEDVVFLNDRVSGLVINWTPVLRERMHVDPLMIKAKVVLDATGHPAEICTLLTRKNQIRLNTPSGGVMGERSLAVDEGELATFENTKEVFPGLFVSGMAANAVSGSSRMGPIFGGMLLSGEKVYQLMRLAIEQYK